jgi:hypothetical protein
MAPAKKKAPANKADDVVAVPAASADPAVPAASADPAVPAASADPASLAVLAVPAVRADPASLAVLADPDVHRQVKELAAEVAKNKRDIGMLQSKINRAAIVIDRLKGGFSSLMLLLITVNSLWF